MHDKPQRIQKLLAQHGLGSRRQIEQWIQEHRIKVNGKVAELGCLASSHDQISVNGRKVIFKLDSFQTEVLIYNKPEGQICSRQDPEERPTIFEHLPRPQHGKWVSIGRLDLNSSGLLLFTNNGEVANQLMHPSANIEREYAVRIQGDLTPRKQQQLLQGVKIEGCTMRFIRLTDRGGQGSNHWYHVVLTEGKYREVRRLFEAVDCRVTRLIRVRFGPIHLPRYLRRGRHELLKGKAYQWCLQHKSC